MKISRKGLMAVLGAATLVAAAARTANASSVFSSGPNQITYHNYENIYDSTGHIITGAAPTTGDYIVGMLSVDLIFPVNNQNGATYNSSQTVQITGIFEQEVYNTTDALGVTTLVLGAAATGSPTTFTDGTAGGSITPGLNTAAGTIFQFYMDTAGAPFKSGGTGSTLSSSFATATAGSKFFSLGFTDSTPSTLSDPANGYFFTQITDATGTVNTYGGMQFLTNLTGNTFVHDGVIDTSHPSVAANIPVGNRAVDMYIDGSINNNVNFQLGGDPLSLDTTNTISPWEYSSSDPAVTNVLVPVPASVWTGLSMLGMMGGIAALRRRKALRA
jgi:hypothetical protein